MTKSKSNHIPHTLIAVCAVIFIIIVIAGCIEIFNIGDQICIPRLITKESIGNYISILSLHFSVVVLTTSLMASLNDKDEVVYYRDIVRKTLKNSPILNFMSLSCYAYVTLAVSIVGIVLKNSYIVLTSALIGGLLIVFLFFRVISVYYGRDKNKLAIERELFVGDKKQYEKEIRDIEIMTTNYLYAGDYERALENIRLIFLMTFIDGIIESKNKSDNNALNQQSDNIRVTETYYFQIYERLKKELEMRDLKRAFEFYIQCESDDYTYIEKMFKGVVMKTHINRCFRNIINDLTRSNMTGQQLDVVAFTSYYDELKDVVAYVLEHDALYSDKLEKTFNHLFNYVIFADDRRNYLLKDMVHYLVANDVDFLMTNFSINKFKERDFTKTILSYLDEKTNNKFLLLTFEKCICKLYDNNLVNKAQRIKSLFSQEISNIINQAKNEDNKSNEYHTYIAESLLEIYILGCCRLMKECESSDLRKKIYHDMLWGMKMICEGFAYSLLFERISEFKYTVKPNIILENRETIMFQILEQCWYSFFQSDYGLTYRYDVQNFIEFTKTWLEYVRPLYANKIHDVLFPQYYYDEIDLDDMTDEEIDEYYDNQLEESEIEEYNREAYKQILLEEQYYEECWNELLSSGKMNVMDAVYNRYKCYSSARTVKNEHPDKRIADLKIETMNRFKEFVFHLHYDDCIDKRELQQFLDVVNEFLTVFSPPYS